MRGTTEGAPRAQLTLYPREGDVPARQGDSAPAHDMTVRLHACAPGAAAAGAHRGVSQFSNKPSHSQSPQLGETLAAGPRCWERAIDVVAHQIERHKAGEHAWRRPACRQCACRRQQREGPAGPEACLLTPALPAAGAHAGIAHAWALPENSEPWLLMVRVSSWENAPGAPHESGRLPFSQLLARVLQAGCDS